MKTLITLLIIIKVCVPMKLKVVKSDTFDIKTLDKSIIYEIKNDSLVSIRSRGPINDSIYVLIKSPKPIKIETPRNLNIIY